MTCLSCTSCGSMPKQVSIWAQWKPSPSTSDVLQSKIYLSPCLSVPVVNSELPSKAAVHSTMARSAGISRFWATAPLTNMNCFTHVCVTGLAAYKEPRMPNVCAGNWAPFAVHTWPFSSAIWKGQDFQILVLRSFHDPHVEKPFPSMVASRTRLHVNGLTVYYMSFVKEWNISTWTMFVCLF